MKKIYVEVKQTSMRFSGTENESAFTICTSGTIACWIIGVPDKLLVFPF